jgi:hypothetical protein
LTHEWTIALSAEEDEGAAKRQRYIVQIPPSHLLRDKNNRKIRPNKKLMSPFLTKQCPVVRNDMRGGHAIYQYITSVSDDTLLK